MGIRNVQFYFTTLNSLKSSIFKLKMTERISRLCYHEYAQMKAIRLKFVNAIH